MALQPIHIINRGRGPELSHVRITVFDIIPYLEDGDTPFYIATVLGISSRDVEALKKYIDDHKEEVMAENQRIEERIARGNPPEVEARLAASPIRKMLQDRLAEIRRRRAEDPNSESDCE
jgi:uncharacterized protein (DUF433 family)